MTRRPAPDDTPPGEAPPIDLNQIVSYNLRAARELHGWTQEYAAAQIEAALGTRVTQATLSAMERAWDADRPRREFTIQDIAAFAVAFKLPMVWFQLAPPGDRRPIRNIGKSLDQLYILLLGTADQLPPLHDRLREMGIRDPTPAEETFERIIGEDIDIRKQSYRQRRKEMILAYLDVHADNLDESLDNLQKAFNHMAQLGLRGIIGAAADDPDFVRKARLRETTQDVSTEEDTTS